MMTEYSLKSGSLAISRIILWSVRNLTRREAEGGDSLPPTLNPISLCPWSFGFHSVCTLFDNEIAYNPSISKRKRRKDKEMNKINLLHCDEVG